MHSLHLSKCSVNINGCFGPVFMDTWTCQEIMLCFCFDTVKMLNIYLDFVCNSKRLI